MTFRIQLYHACQVFTHSVSLYVATRILAGYLIGHGVRAERKEDILSRFTHLVFIYILELLHLVGPSGNTNSVLLMLCNHRSLFRCTHLSPPHSCIRYRH